MSGQVELLISQGPSPRLHVPEEDFYVSASQEDRIREVFGLPAGLSLPRVTVQTLGRYHGYLDAHLRLPFRALYAETRPPITRLIRHITVLALQPPRGPVSRGIVCRD